MYITGRSVVFKQHRRSWSRISGGGGRIVCWNGSRCPKSLPNEIPPKLNLEDGWVLVSWRVWGTEFWWPVLGWKHRKNYKEKKYNNGIKVMCWGRCDLRAAWDLILLRDSKRKENKLTAGLKFRLVLALSNSMQNQYWIRKCI